MTAAPKVSVVIPVYNGSNYLAEAIHSALSQTYRNFEVLVVNDGSTDDGATAKVAAKFKDHIVYIEKENGGVSTALNLGIEKMRGELFAWLSHDDAFLPEKLERQVEMFVGSSIGLCYSDYHLMDAAGEIYRTVESPIHPQEDFLRQQLLMNNINGCTVVISRKVLGSNPFDPARRYCQDGDLWIRLLRQGVVFGKVAEPLIKYRVHAEADSFTASRKQYEDIGDLYRALSLTLRPEEVFPHKFRSQTGKADWLDLQIWLGQTVRQSWGLHSVERDILIRAINAVPFPLHRGYVNFALSYPRRIKQILLNKFLR